MSFYRKNETQAMLSQRTSCIRIWKQEKVSLIALFHCLITIENICVQFSQADSKKSQEYRC